MKICCKCKHPQSYSEFHKDKSRKDGFNPMCKTCVKEYRLHNKEHIRITKVKYRKDNIESIVQKERKYYRSNKKSIINKSNEYVQNNWEQTLCSKSKGRAKLLNLEHTILSKDIIIPDRCIYLGVPLTRIRGKGHVPTNASIDRIDSAKGYTKDNIQIISCMANVMKNNATNAQLVTFAKNVLALQST